MVTNPAALESRGESIALDEERARLAQVVSIDEAKQIRDQGHAIKHYAKEQKLSREIQHTAAEVTIRAERRCGELLSEVPRTPPEVSGAMKGRSPRPGGTSKTYEQVLDDSGIAPTTARRWQAEASIQEPIFETFVAPNSASRLLCGGAALQLAPRHGDGEPVLGEIGLHGELLQLEDGHVDDALDGHVTGMADGVQFGRDAFRAEQPAPYWRALRSSSALQTRIGSLNHDGETVSELGNRDKHSPDASADFGGSTGEERRARDPQSGEKCE